MTDLSEETRRGLAQAIKELLQTEEFAPPLRAQAQRALGSIDLMFMQRDLQQTVLETLREWLTSGAGREWLLKNVLLQDRISRDADWNFRNEVEVAIRLHARTVIKQELLPVISDEVRSTFERAFEDLLNRKERPDGGKEG